MRASMRQAQYENIEDDVGFFGRIPALDGVWASAPSLENCREELEEVLEDWLLFRVSERLPIPAMEGIELRVRKVA